METDQDTGFVVPAANKLLNTIAGATNFFVPVANNLRIAIAEAMKNDDMNEAVENIEIDDSDTPWTATVHLRDGSSIKINREDVDDYIKNNRVKIAPTAEQAMSCMKLCQMLSNCNCTVHLFRYDTNTRLLTIFAGTEIIVVIPPSGNWSFE